MAIGRCQPPYLSGAVFIDSDRSFSQERVDQRAFIISVNIYISQEQLTQESMEGVEAAEGQTS